MLGRSWPLLALACTVALSGCGDDGGDSADDARTPDAGVGSDAASSRDVGGSADGSGASDGSGSTDDECSDNADFFDQQLWPDVLQPVCGACHTPQGIARDSGMVFVSSAVPTYLDDNYDIVDEVSRLERDGISLLLLKPSMQVEHGGGEVAPVGSEAYAMLEEFVARRDDPVVCDDDGEVAGDEGLVLLDPAATLRKATLHLTGTLPDDDSLASVEAGGEEALRTRLDSVLREPAFEDYLRVLFNDVFLTDRYLGGQSAIQQLDDDDYPNRYWYDAIEDNGTRNRYRNAANVALARQPVELAVHVVREQRPFTEVLTADYVLVNDYSGRSLGLYGGALPDLDNPATYQFRVEQLPGVPHAGVLTTPTFLARYPSTATNRNRHRARIFFDYFLATDLLSLAERPIDPNASAYHNPTLNDPQCTVCHTIMDPVAGAFQNWDNDGDREIPEDGWYPDLAPPGFGDLQLPSEERQRSLQWLAAQTVEDRRFAIAMVQLVFESVTGQEVRQMPRSDQNPLLRPIVERQRAFFDEVADAFVESNYDLRTIFTEVMLSPWFRAVDTTGAAPEVEETAGTFRLRSPEQLSRTIEAVSRYPWSSAPSNTPYLMDRYRLLYGGIDSDAVTKRLTAPNGLMLNIAERMAGGVACRSTSYDFVLDAEQRHLFPHVEPSFVPETPEGFEVPDAVLAIRQNIAHLFDTLLGEQVDVDGVEVDAAYALFYDTWSEGVAGIADESISGSLPWQCRAESDFWTGTSFEDRRVRNDENYVIRSWMAVMTYLLGDARFLYE